MSTTDAGSAAPTGGDGQSANWSVAIFAHNEAADIAAAIERVLAEGPAQALTVVVLANGCSDRTAAIAEELAGRHVNLQVVDIALTTRPMPGITTCTRSAPRRRTPRPRCMSSSMAT